MLWRSCRHPLKLRAAFAMALLLGAIPMFAQSNPVRPPITGIAYVRFYESDIPAAKTFFAERLGLPESNTKLGSTFSVGARQAIQITPLPSPAPPNRLARVAFQTSDIPGMKRFLTAHQIAFEAGGRNEIDLKDPEGNPIAFLNQPAQPIKPKPNQSATRIIHAGWGVLDRSAENRFFIDLLGFRPYWYGGSQEGKISWVSLQVPDGSDWIEYMLDYKPATDDLKRLGGMDHVSLGVTKITDVTDRLIANGWTDPNTRKSQIGRDGKWQLNVFDPDHSRIEFMEFTPVQKPCCSEPTASHPTP